MINVKADTTSKGITATVRWRLKSPKVDPPLASARSAVTTRMIIAITATAPKRADPVVAVITVQTMSLRSSECRLAHDSKLVKYF